MFKILFVDDEPIMLRMLRHLLPWEELDIEICGEAYNGQEALALVGQHHPDIILVDIKMPLMDGTQFMEEMKRQNEQGHVIVISAYQEFEYAQKALHAGAKGYVVKPLDEDKLLELIARIKVEIANDKQEKKQRKILEQNRFISEMIERERTVLTLNEPLGHLGFDQVKGRFYIALFKQEGSINEVYGIVNNWIKTYEVPIEVFIYKNELVAIIGYDSQEEQWKIKFNRLTNELIEDLQEAGNYAIIGISEVHDQLHQLNRAYQEANLAASEVFYTTDKRIYWHNETTFNQEKIQLSHGSMDQELMQAIEFHILPQICETVNQFFGYIQKSRYIPDNVRLYGYEWILSIKRNIQTMLKSNDSLESAIYFEDFKKLNTAMEMQQYMENVFIQFAETVYKSKQNRTEIDRVKMFILQHFQECEITLEKISEHVDMSKNYLSKLFKQSEGKGIWDYLTDIRMRKAKELLSNTDLKVYQIAERVGYDNIYYFSKLFKKTCGVTPLEYKR